MITITDAKKLRKGQYIYAVGRFNTDGTPVRAKVTSVAVSKRDPGYVRVHFILYPRQYGVLAPFELEKLTTKRPKRVDRSQFVVSRSGNVYKRVGTTK